MSKLLVPIVEKKDKSIVCMWISPEDVDSDSLLDSSRDSKIWDNEEKQNEDIPVQRRVG